MGIRKWFNSGHETIRLGRPATMQSDHDGHAGWLSFWRKFKREKKRIFNPHQTPSMHGGAAVASYDPETYSMNFDRGMEWAEPDNLSRSFSARFAYPVRSSAQESGLLD
ncbi:hypothetical protein L1049_017823 [Liquidambar formosana]|uniref:Uncharacterized protein n=1 Tax=Liquidambar formosana TaxID=63359 RepID=A0AAP0R9L0_LIQFO